MCLRWLYSAALPIESDLEDAAVLNGELLVRQIRCVHASRGSPCAVRFNVQDERWTVDDSVMSQSWHGPSVVLDGSLYMLDQIGGIKLMRFDAEKNAWLPVGRVSPALLTPPCKLIGHQGQLYIVGRGASMVVVNLLLNKRLDSSILITRRIQGTGCTSDIVVSCVVLQV